MNGKTDTSAERERLPERDAEWAAIASEGRDMERILSYWTNDAVVIPPGFAPVIGKAALRDYVENSLRIPGFTISWKSRDVVFSPDLKLAYMFAENTITMNGPEGGRVTTKGQGLRRRRSLALRCRHLEPSTATGDEG